MTPAVERAEKARLVILSDIMLAMLVYLSLAMGYCI